MTASVPIRQPCPPGACRCGHAELLADPSADQRVLCLTRHEEQRLLQRLEALQSLDDLQHMLKRMEENLGIRVEITVSATVVRSLRGIRIQVQEQAGLCRKTRQTIPTAIRHALNNQPEILYRLLDAQDLLHNT